MSVNPALEKWIDSFLEQEKQHLQSQEHPPACFDLDLEKPTFPFCILSIQFS